MDRVVPVAHLRARYRYCAQSGKITHRYGCSKAPIGSEAGTLRPDGYRVIKVPFEGKRVQIMAHVVAWAMHHGEYPPDEVDHENTIRTDNWIDNLRDANRSQNGANRPKRGLLPKGVTFDKNHKSRPYKAQIKCNGKNRFLGHFVDPMAAHQAYLTEATKAFGEFVRA